MMLRDALIAGFTLAMMVSAAEPGQAQDERPPLVTLHEERNPLIAFRIMFESGSVDDPPGQEGITALAARMMAEGGTEELSSAELLDALFPMAAELGVSVDKELTVFTGRIHRDHTDRFLKIFVDVLLRPRWDPKEFDRLKDVQISAIENELRSNDDEEFGKETLEWMLYKGHPYGHPVDGTVSGLKSLDLATVKAHAAKVFTSNRVTIGIAGGYSDRLPGVLQKAALQLPKGPEPMAIPVPKPSGPSVVIVEKETPATAISMGYPYGLKRNNPDFVPMWLGVSAFGEHRQSGGRLFQALREKRGLNYGDYAYAEVFHQDGWGTHPRTDVGRTHQQFSIWIRPVEHHNRVFVIRGALWELDKLLQHGLDPDEVTRAQGFLDGYTRLWEMTTSRRLGFALDDRFNGTHRYLASSRERFPSISTDSVNATLRKWIDPSQLRFAIITEDAEAMRRALVSDEPSPIVYPTPKDDEVLEEDKLFIGRPFGFGEEEVVVVKAGDMFEK